MIFKISIVCLALIALARSEIEEESGPRLLFFKQILNKYLVQNKDIEVKYTLYNIGSSAAVGVELVDQGFHPEAFEYVGGHIPAKFDRIPPQSNVSHVYIVRPLKYGYFNFTSAQASYKTSDDANAKVSSNLHDQKMTIANY